LAQAARKKKRKKKSLRRKSQRRRLREPRSAAVRSRALLKVADNLSKQMFPTARLKLREALV